MLTRAPAYSHERITEAAAGFEADLSASLTEHEEWTRNERLFVQASEYNKLFDMHTCLAVAYSRLMDEFLFNGKQKEVHPALANRQIRYYERKIKELEAEVINLAT